MATILDTILFRRTRGPERPPGLHRNPGWGSSFRPPTSQRHAGEPGPSWGWKTVSGWWNRIPIPAKVDGQWVEEQLNTLPALVRKHNEELVLDFLERLLTATGVRGNHAIQTRVLCVLEARLSALNPPDKNRLHSCLRQMEALLAQSNDGIDVGRLKLRGVATRLRTQLRPNPEEALSPPSALLRANAALARSMRVPNDTQTLTAAGEAYLESGLYEVAEHCLQRTDNRAPQDGGRAAFLLGQCTFHLEQYERAAQTFDRAVTQGWPQAEVTTWQAGALYESDRPLEAEQCARAGLASAQGQSAAPLHALLGKIYLGQQDTEEAERWFTQAYTADATGADARYGLGLCALARGDGEAAGTLFLSLLGHPDGGALGVLGLGMLAAEQDDLPLAIQHLTEAVRHFPAHGVAHARLGECLFEAGEYAKALSHCARAQELGIADPALLLRQGLAALAIGNRATPYTLLRAYHDAGQGGIDVTPYLVNALVQMMDDAIARGDHARALVVAEEWYQRAPHDPPAAERLGLLLYSVARAHLMAGQANAQTGALFARAAELYMTEATTAGAVAAKIFRADGASLDDILSTLGPAAADSPFVSLVRLLAAYRRGDHDAIAHSLATLPVNDTLLGKLHRFITLHTKVVQSKGREKLSAEERGALLALFADPEFRREFAGQREAVNRLLVSLLFDAQGRNRPDRVLKVVEEFAQSDREGFWQEARAFAQFLSASRADSFTECRNLVALCRQGNASDKPFVAELLMRGERAEVAKLLDTGNFPAAYDLLAVQMRAGRADPLSQRVAHAIDTFLSTDSLEGADLAKNVGNSKRAREIWEGLVRQGNAQAAHQMAVSLFTQGYAEVLQKDDHAIPTLASALPYWKLVYEADSYWQQQREKCQVLSGQSSNNPFRAETLEQTRKELPMGTLAVLAELAIRYARANNKKQARASVQAILDTPFGRALGRQTLEDVFAPPLLMRGVLNGSAASRFEQALGSAELVLDCDPENRQALSLALEAASAQGDDARKRLTLKFAKAGVPLFSRARRRLQQFPETEVRSNAPLLSRCKFYWHEFGSMLDLATSQAITEYQSTQDPIQERQFLREMRRYTDCAFNHVFPACTHWQVEPSWRERFDNWNSQLKELGFHPDPHTDC